MNASSSRRSTPATATRSSAALRSLYLADAGVFALGFAVSLIGDAGHVSSGMTRYAWPGVPSLWYSAVWFPFVVAGSILVVARIGRGLGLPGRARTRTQAALGVAAVLVLYSMTAAFYGQPDPVTVPLTVAAGVGIWAFWDPTRRTFLLALACACVGPLAEIGFVQLGAVEYGEQARALWGVSPMLPGLYFAAATVASGLHRSLMCRELSEGGSGRP